MVWFTMLPHVDQEILGCKVRKNTKLLVTQLDFSLLRNLMVIITSIFNFCKLKNR